MKQNLTTYAVFLLTAALSTSALAQSSSGVSFAPAITFPTAVEAPNAIAAGDINNDGIIDIAVASTQYAVFNFALGNGDGTFGAWGLGPSGQAPLWVTLADVNQDGNLDALTSDGQNYSIDLALGDGKGGFTFGGTLPSGRGGVAYQISVADVNRDGIPDIIETTECYGGAGSLPGSISVFLGKGKGAFGKVKSYSTGGACPANFAIGDMNNDGIPDIVIANSGDFISGQHADVAVLLGAGDGSFKPFKVYGAGPMPFLPALGDFDADGSLDVAEMNGFLIHLFDGNGDGTLTPWAPYKSGIIGWLAVADFNGDGKPDIAVSRGNVVAILLGNGDGTFQPPARTFVTGIILQSTRMVVADFNNDGRPDIAVANNGDSTVSILLNTTKFPAK